MRASRKSVRKKFNGSTCTQKYTFANPVLRRYDLNDPVLSRPTVDDSNCCTVHIFNMLRDQI